MQAEIIAVGSELLTPDRIDTNSLFLTQRLNHLGIAVARNGEVVPKSSWEVTTLRAGDANLRANAVSEGVAEAKAVMAGLAEAGVDFHDVTAVLEREGVDAFAASFRDALATIEKRRAEVSG